MISQNHEDDLYLNLLGSPHTQPTLSLLDIGAFDGAHISNTRGLLMTRPDAKAVLIEPCPSSFLNLVSLYGFNPNINLINAAIVPTPVDSAVAKWYWSNGSAVSTFDEVHRDHWETREKDRQKPFVPIWIKPVVLADLLAQFPGPYDLISIDTEASSAAIFFAFPDEVLKAAKVIVVEHDRQDERIIKRGDKLGFCLAAQNGENVVLIRRTSNETPA